MSISASACTTPSMTSLMYQDRFSKGTRRVQEHNGLLKVKGLVLLCPQVLRKSLSFLSSRQSQVRRGHGSTGSGTCTSTGRRKRFQRLSLKVQLKNRGDTNRVLSVLGKTKVWSVLDLSRNKNQVLEFYNKVLRRKKKKRKSGLLPAATLNNISTQKHPKNYLICIQ